MPGFGPAGFHTQASGPSWAGALRLPFCQSVLCLTQTLSLVQLVVDDGLIQVISLEMESLDLLGWSPFIHGLLMGPDDLEGLLQKRLAGLSHAQDRSFHCDLFLDPWAR